MKKFIGWAGSSGVAIGWALLFAIVPFSQLVQAANGSVTYAYDALGRVVAAAYDTGACVVYAYDPVGNRTNETIMVLNPTGTAVWDCSSWDSAKWGS